MAYKNQNYMTNKLIKETVDRNQKGYVSEDTEEEKQVYAFTLYEDAEGTVELGQGTVEVEETGDDYTKIKVLTNSTDQSFVGQSFYVQSDAEPGETIYELFSDDEGTSAHIYVLIQEIEEESEE